MRARSKSQKVASILLLSRSHTKQPTDGGWGVEAARREAARLKRQIDVGGDPLDDLKKERQAPTVEELCEDYRKKHLPTKRPKSQIDDQAIIE